jgi:ribosomal protein S27E
MAEVIQFGDLSLRRAERLSRLDADRCKHHNITLDDNGGIVTCDDCGKQLSAFWVLQMMTDQYEAAWRKVRAASERVNSEASQSLHLRAAAKVEKAWRSRTMVPICPHCSEAILPSDGLGGAQVNREIAMARRDAMKASKGGA